MENVQIYAMFYVCDLVSKYVSKDHNVSPERIYLDTDDDISFIYIHDGVEIKYHSRLTVYCGDVGICRDYTVKEEGITRKTVVYERVGDM